MLLPKCFEMSKALLCGRWELWIFSAVLFVNALTGFHLLTAFTGQNIDIKRLFNGKKMKKSLEQTLIIFKCFPINPISFGPSTLLSYISLLFGYEIQCRQRPNEQWQRLQSWATILTRLIFPQQKSSPVWEEAGFGWSRESHREPPVSPSVALQVAPAKIS